MVRRPPPRPGRSRHRKLLHRPNPIDTADAAYAPIIARERASIPDTGDHFASAATNDRIWNSFSKHCLTHPSSFLTYYSNPLLKLVSEAYLGPAYRVTAQVNVVKPGGKAQLCHRDYHLGFQKAEEVARWLWAMHDARQLLTLQGAMAHCDMPLESGPTRLLPFSQLYRPGFVAYRLAEFQEYFSEKYVCLPLRKGNVIFFNPRLFHAAGENVSGDLEGSANLLQISSASGTPMEKIDNNLLVDGAWDQLVEKYRKEGMSEGVHAFLCAVTEGYQFPTNLDRRPPAPNGMAPEGETDVVREGLVEGWSRGVVAQALKDMRPDAEA